MKNKTMSEKKGRKHAHIQRDYRELLNYIGLAVIFAIILVWPLLPHAVPPLNVDISYAENEAVFIAMSPAETDEDWYLYPEFWAKHLEKYPELHKEMYEEREIYHTSYRVVLRLPVLITNKGRESIMPIVSSSGYLYDDEDRYLGYGRYAAFDQYTGYLYEDLTKGQTIRVFDHFDFSPGEFDKASYVSLQCEAFIVENEKDIREGEGPAIIIEITEDTKSKIRAEGERIMETFVPPEPVTLSSDEYAEWEFDAIITDAYTWADDTIAKSGEFGRNYAWWHRDNFGYSGGSGDRRIEGDSIITNGYAGIDNHEYSYEMVISIDSWRVTRLVIGDIELV